MWALQECLAELHLVDLGPNYDFISVRAGIQPFVRRFRGFIFKDTNLGVRLFARICRIVSSGTWPASNSWKGHENSQSQHDPQARPARLHCQPLRAGLHLGGLHGPASFHNSRDDGDVHYDNNDFLVRPPRSARASPRRDPFYFG